MFQDVRNFKQLGIFLVGVGNMEYPNMFYKLSNLVYKTIT